MFVRPMLFNYMPIVLYCIVCFIDCTQVQNHTIYIFHQNAEYRYRKIKKHKVTNITKLNIGWIDKIVITHNHRSVTTETKGKKRKRLMIDSSSHP